MDARKPTTLQPIPAAAEAGLAKPAVFPWPRTPWCRLRAYFASPHFASAVQLTLGVLFLSLFVVIDKLRFPLACQSSVVFAALAIQLFPNPAMGGRIAASLVAASCICIGAIAGGGAVAAAWAATGAGDRSLASEVKAIMAGPPSPAKSALLAKVAAAQSAAKGAATGAAPAAKPSLGQAVAVLNEGIVPLVGPAFYGTLCVAGTLVLAVFAAVRCDPSNKAVGSLGSILALLAGLVIANAGAVPIMGIRVFWQKIVRDVIIPHNHGLGRCSRCPSLRRPHPALQSVGRPTAHAGRHSGGRGPVHVGAGRVRPRRRRCGGGVNVCAARSPSPLPARRPPRRPCPPVRGHRQRGRHPARRPRARAVGEAA